MELLKQYICPVVNIADLPQSIYQLSLNEKKLSMLSKIRVLNNRNHFIFMLKNIWHICLFVLVCFSGFSQELTPVKWKISTESLGREEFNIVFTAQIEEGWSVYSYYLDEDAGPVPTQIEYEHFQNVELIAKPEETGHKKEGKDPLFDDEVLIKYLSDKPYTIRQRIKLTAESGNVRGYLTFMTCDDSKCLPPTDIDFDLDISSLKLDNNKSEPKYKLDGKNENDLLNQSGESDSAYRKNLKINAQILNHDISEETPVSWNASLEQIDIDVYQIQLIAEIDEGWSMYSYYTEEGGPEPTKLTLEQNDQIETLGEPLEEGHKKEGPDALFGGINVIKIFADQPYSYTQKIRFDENLDVIEAYVTYMACDDEKCLPPTDVEIRFNISVENGSTQESLVELVGDNQVIDQSRPQIISTFESPVGDCDEDTGEKNTSIYWMFILGFLGGLLALLTPCVFPMIPLTVSFFTKDNKRKGWWNGTLYGLSIIVIYVTIGLALTLLFGEEALNRLSTNWIANSLFFIIFILFAFSFFGYYELTLPSSWVNKSDQMADKGGLLGMFFMAFTLALVSFSCTGPIIGSAIVQAASNQVGPFVVMFGFALALAIPFGLFAAFPSWLNTLPKSGSWMTNVKVVLGFLELALAFKFLSVADMTNHWGFLRYEVFMGLWVLIFALLSLYLFGFIRFPHDSPVRKLSKTRWAFALAFTGLTIYLMSGFQLNSTTQSYQSLKLMSGLAPPTQYNFFLKEPAVDPIIKAKYPSFSKCANNLDCFKDYYDGLAYSKEVNKPILLDHTGYGCVNCRKTEEHIWTDDRVREKISSDYVLVSLYVDDDKKLDETLISKTRNKKLRNIGNKWADFQIVNFRQNSQPLYVLMTPKEQVISEPRGYKEGVESYLEFLNCGLESFNRNLKTN